MSYSDGVTLSEKPDYALRNTTKAISNRINFGDGYSQFVGIGAVVLRREYTLTYSKSSSDADVIEALLFSTKRVGKIIWQPDMGPSGKWIYSNYKRTVDTYGVHTISFTLKEVLH